MKNKIFLQIITKYIGEPITNVSQVGPFETNGSELERICEDYYNAKLEQSTLRHFYIGKNRIYQSWFFYLRGFDDYYFFMIFFNKIFMDVKTRPILFSTPMVIAIDKDFKNQTRRTKGLEFFNESPEKYRYDGNEQPDLLEPLDKDYHWFEFIGSDGRPMEAYKSVKCPYGKVGDILWVRESFVKDGDSFVYRATHKIIENFIKWNLDSYAKKAARTFLKITKYKSRKTS